jgi:hypothetical protein
MELYGKKYTVLYEAGRGGPVRTLDAVLVSFHEGTGMFVFDRGRGKRKLINKNYLIEMRDYE